MARGGEFDAWLKARFGAWTAAVMMRAGDVLSAALSLSWKGAIVAAAICLIASKSAGPGGSRGINPREAALQTAPATTTGDATHVRMGLASGGLQSEYALDDEQGNELLRVTYAHGVPSSSGWGSRFPSSPVSRQASTEIACSAWLNATSVIVSICSEAVGRASRSWTSDAASPGVSDSPRAAISWKTLRSWTSDGRDHVAPRECGALRR
jgi:hypothetical protein